MASPVSRSTPRRPATTFHFPCWSNSICSNSKGTNGICFPRRANRIMSLRLLAEGTGPDGNGTPAIDIVAVHGLNPINSTDHAFNTWRKPLSDKGSLWLRDSFPNAQPNARIYVYEYNSSPVFGAAKDSFVGEANQLLDEIYGERWQTNNGTPIIFVGHSLGGILIKQALVNAWANEKYRGIKEATHALVFFGTPHSGPSRNIQVGLGMACARIARSLPFQQTSKIIEILEGGTLFSDLLSESFRHQLEQYKILLCYEGLGDIVPFDSAVLGLPGKRETQLRINADHSNMCRFDLAVQADKDNYRKVERNLQMLCADALVKTASSDVRMNNGASQGGIDLSSVLLQQLDLGGIQGNLLLRNYADAPDLAWQVYRLCEQSRAATFAEASADVSRLFIGVRSLKDRLETDTFSTDNSPQIQDVMSKCCRTLQAFQTLVDTYQATPQRSRAHWNSNSSREEFYGLKALKADLQGNISMINSLNRDLARRSMNDLTQRLDEVIEILNGGEAENLSALSSSLSRASLSNVEDWSNICPDLVEAGLSRSMLSEQGEYIQQWLLNAVKAGRVDMESLPDQDTRTVNSAHLNGVQGHAVNDASSDIMTIRSTIRSSSPGPGSVLTRYHSGDSQNGIHDMATSAPATRNSTRTSKGWTHSLTSKLRHGTLNSNEAIAKAVISGDVSSAEKILASTTKVVSSWDGWDNVLRTATVRGYTTVVRDILALVSLTGREYHWRNCLRDAIRIKNVKMVSLFLDNDIQFEAEQVVHAMEFAPESMIERMLAILDDKLDHERYAHHLLYATAKHSHEDVFQSLVAQYGGINAAINETTPFHLACRSGNAKSIQFALDLGANARVTDDKGNSPLHALILGGSDPRDEIGAAIMLLVRNGVPLRAESGDGKTALHLAAECAHLKAIEALIQMGLSPDTQTAEGKTPLHVACKSEWAQRTVERWVPGYLTGNFNDFNVTQIDLSKIEEVSLKDPRENKYASKQGGEAIRILLRYGASVNVRGIENVTPLHLASESGKPARIKVLLEHGADPHAVDDLGWTSLHYAVVSGSQDAIDLILPYDVDLNKSVLATIMGEHKKQLNATELLQMVNKGRLRGLLRLGNTIGETTLTT